MTQGRPVEAEKRAQVIALHADGLSRNAIARKVKLAGATVTRICAEEGLEFDRAMTALAVRAHKIDLAEARMLAAKKIAVRIDELLEDMDAPVEVYNFGGKDNTFAYEILDAPAIESRQRMMTAVGIGFDKVSRIVERDNGGLDQAVGVLDQIAEGFKAAADKYRTEATDESQ